MSIIAHIFTLLILLVLSGDIAAIAGRKAQALNLAGSSLATLTPMFVFCTYILAEGLAATRLRFARWLHGLEVALLIYPAVIFSSLSHSIEIAGSLSSYEVMRFKQEFGVPLVMQSSESSFEITVAQRDFRPEMVQWLKSYAASVSNK